MRRIITIGTALTVLITAGAAYAFLNQYSASFTYQPTKAGSAKHPVTVGFTEKLAAKSTTPGNRAAPLVDITTTQYGIKSNGKPFPTCTSQQITRNHGNGGRWDKACPPGSQVATGVVHAVLGPSVTLAGAGTPCNPLLHVYNAPNSKLTFFFLTDATHKCGSLKTGASAPYVGKSHESGKNLITDVPLPPDVSTSAGGLPGVYGSLIAETLNFKKISKKVKGKTVSYLSSFACKGSNRPFSVKFTAVNKGKKETRTVTGNSKCTK